MNASSHSQLVSVLFAPGRDLAGLRAPAGANPQRRLDVHRNNVVVSLIDALAETFPVTRALVGDAFFRDMARERVRVDPPRSPILFRYGEGFADFIERVEGAAHVPYLADMARLEYLRVRCYHGEDAQALQVAAFQALLESPERLPALRMDLHPSCAWMRSDHAVLSLWRAHQGLEDMADADLSDIDLLAPEAVLVTRPRWSVEVHAIDLQAYAWLAALGAGSTLGALVDQGAAPSSEPAQLTALLTLLIQHGLVVAHHPSAE